MEKEIWEVIEEKEDKEIVNWEPLKYKEIIIKKYKSSKGRIKNIIENKK